ncbi:MAG: ABC transporter substrate-binding protein [Candidatus Marsarchaeota archaeon]|nr:ABC transporter substrate-binding protein [Candidatus Marsarchaeota archaeon]
MAAIVVVIIIIAAAAVVLTRPTSHSSTTSSSPVSTSSTSSTSATPPSTKIPSNITVDEVPAPVSVDPASSYDVDGIEIIQNVYQNLIFYNGSSSTTYVGVLAKSWSESTNGTVYTFNLWPFIKFSDGVPLNASSVWFSFYRTMMVNLGISFYISEYFSVNNGKGFVGITGSGQKGLIELPNGIEQALASAGVPLSSNQTVAMQQAANDLANILSHFNAANSTISKVMAYPNQAIHVAGTDTVVMHLDYAFSDFYQTISGGDGAVVDPVFVDANGGVKIDTANTYLTSHALGSGPYELATPIGGSSVILKANPNYWAKNVPASESNLMLTVPKISTIVIDYQSSEAIRVSDIKQGLVAISAVEIPDLSEVSSIPSITIHNWGPSATIDFLTMDAYQYPFNITQVRLAIEYGVNATQVQQDVYKGYAQSYLGPLDPVMAFYNSSIHGYAYNPSESIKLLEQAGFSVPLPNGTTLNPSGKTLPTLPLTYNSASEAEQEEGTVVQQQLAQVGIKVTLNPESFTTIIEGMLAPASSSTYPGFQIAGNTPVFIGPSDPTVYLTYCPVRCHHGDPAYLNDSVVNSLVYQILHTANTAQLQQLYDELTVRVNEDAQYVWLDDFTAYTVSLTSLQGLWYNPGLTGIFYATLY